MWKLIKIQQTPKYNAFYPNIFSTPKQILKWKTNLWLIEKAPLRFLETFKKSTFDEEIWRYASTLASLKVFGRNLSGLGNQLVKRYAKVRAKLDEDSFRLLKTSINKSPMQSLINRSTISNELWKWLFSEIGLRQNESK